MTFVPDFAFRAHRLTTRRGFHGYLQYCPAASSGERHQESTVSKDTNRIPAATVTENIDEGKMGQLMVVLQILIAMMARVTQSQPDTPQQLASSGVCPDHRLYDPVSEKIYTIPETIVGQLFSSPQVCLANGLPYVTLECLENAFNAAQWSRFEPNQGCNFSDMTTSSATASLKKLSSFQMDFIKESRTEVLNNTLLLIQDANNTLSAVDIIHIADIIQLSIAGSSRSSNMDAKLVLDVTDIVLQVKDSILQESRKVGNATNRLIVSLELLGDRTELGQNHTLRLVTDSTALEVWDLTHMSGDLVIGLEHRLTNGVSSRFVRSQNLFTLLENDELDLNDTDVAIFLPGDFLKNVTEENPGQEVRLSMGVFADTALFGSGSLESRMPDKSGSHILNSKVVSARISVNGTPITDLASYNVTTVFLPHQTLSRAQHVRHTRCVFWNFDGAGGQAAWSDEGCTLQENKLGRDVCQFNHLTNFAVLMDLYGQSELSEDHHRTLSIISIVGLSLSISGLSLTVITFLRISKLRQGRRQQVLFNLALAMLLSWIVFLGGFARRVHGNHVSCLAVAALLHYLILASFMWMLMEGVLAYLMLVKVFDASYSRFMAKAALFAWGLPIVPVAGVIAIDPELYHGGEKYCWMSRTPFYYAFLLPVAMVMLTNIVVYILVVVSICRRRGLAAKASRSASSQRAVEIRASFSCFVVLGLSWVFAFFAIEDARVVFQYLFTITTSLQGFLVFLVFTARNADVKSFLRHLTVSRNPSTSTTTSSGSGSSPKAAVGTGTSRVTLGRK